MHAQQPPPAPAPRFDVGSIKPNLSGLRALQKFEFAPGGRFTTLNATLVDMFVQAYLTRRVQMESGPGWIDSDRFDVEVKPAQMRLRLRSLLEDRFQLKLPTETREMPALSVVAAKTGARLVECHDADKSSLVPASTAS